MDNNIGKLRNEMNNNIGNLRNEMNSQLGNYVQKPKQARLYEHPDRKGNFWVLSISNECNSDVWAHHQMNDRASSIDVQGNCVILYDHANCGGHSARFDAHCSNGCCGDFRKCGINDVVSSYRAC
uniref:Beta/gamma crystallin 'Greek key' domain-containing protein n=1 Tax=Acrobeloides nanus TaxID=290746 RepID=A0A914DMR7_9BILA